PGQVHARRTGLDHHERGLARTARVDAATGLPRASEQLSDLGLRQAVSGRAQACLRERGPGARDRAARATARSTARSTALLVAARAGRSGRAAGPGPLESAQSTLSTSRVRSSLCRLARATRPR